MGISESVELAKGWHLGFERLGCAEWWAYYFVGEGSWKREKGLFED